MRQFARFPFDDLNEIKSRLLAWAGTFPVCVYLDSNLYPAAAHRSWECLVAVGVADSFQAGAGRAFEDMQAFCEQKQDWLFGFFGYDLKNEVEKLHSRHPDGIGLPDLYFFQPEIVVGVRSANPPETPGGFVRELEIHTLHQAPDTVMAAVRASPVSGPLPERAASKVLLNPRISRARYLATVEAIRQHIIEGDVYELNLCQEFFSEQAQIDPLATFSALNAATRAPFAAYMRCNEHHLLCASPERFLRKSGAGLVSQPIKGTRRRHANPEEDRRIRDELRHSVKDRAENVMIVDLVRNDLARHCLPGSVRVDELFGIYSFQTVHQMISTVRGALRPEAHPIEALRDAFPMGSMTGAPKVMAMELIEQYECTRRGLFSGAVGYFTPEGDFDFNVVIRSILYHAGSGYLSCQVGGAIVYDSEPEQEYEECLIKLGALRRVLE